jgi:hypothetical protein
MQVIGWFKSFWPSLGLCSGAACHRRFTYQNLYYLQNPSKFKLQKIAQACIAYPKKKSGKAVLTK